MLPTRDFDAVVVGAGPNGLSAAITLQQAGLSVALLEAKATVGGGMRTAELTLPGFHHDICSAIHPLGADSPVFKKLPLHDHGLSFIFPPVAVAHPFHNGTAAALYPSIVETAKTLGVDERAYQSFMQPLVDDWPLLAPSFLGPFRFPRYPFKAARFGIYGVPPATLIARHVFRGRYARAFFAGMAAHSIMPLNRPVTSALGLVLAILGHTVGWPLPKGGSQQIANALAAYFTSIGGKITVNHPVRSLSDVPTSHAVLFDLTPRQLLQIAGHTFSLLYRWQLQRFRYGVGVFKVDWALDGPIPFAAPECRQAGTVHIGSSLEEIAAGEAAIWRGKHPERPFVLLAQQSLFDATRAPDGKHTGWAYCHAPHGSTMDMTDIIERQVERVAPGFRERIIARHPMNTAALEAYNENYFGGDINGGVQSIDQLFTRPALRLSPYKTSKKGLYICSSSTPPGGGVHGINGYYAAKRALQDVFGIQLPSLQ